MTERVRTKMSWWKKLLIIMISAILAGFMVEGILQFFEAGKSQMSQVISLQDIQVKNGDKMENLYVMKDHGEIKIDVSGMYVNKFQYYYASEKNFQAEIIVETSNLYGDWEKQKIQDPCRSNLNNSFVNIKNNVKSITLRMPEGVTVGDFTVNNAKDSNGYRILYICVFVGVFLFFLLFKKEIGKRVELGFLLISMTIGMLFIAIQPPQFTSWDEHIHFYHVFDFLRENMWSGTRQNITRTLIRNPRKKWLLLPRRKKLCRSSILMNIPRTADILMKKVVLLSAN